MTMDIAEVAVADLPSFEPMRLVLLALFTVAFLLYTWNTSRMWRDRSAPSNLLALGFLLVLAYVSAGQVKAAAYNVPIDLLTLLGGCAATTVVSALFWLQHRSRTHGRA